MKYWAVGTNEKIDNNYLSKKRWSFDYSTTTKEGRKLRKWVKDRVNIGDMVALKTRNIKGKSLKIFAIGKVVNKFNDNSGFNVDWEKVSPPRVTKSTFGQTSAIRQVKDNEAIEEIFGFENLNNMSRKNTMNIKNIILYGAPGVGKTHNTNKLIRLIEDGKSDKEIFEVIKDNENSATVDISDIKERVKFVTFHQSFGYEDFIEGFRPNEDGAIELVDGIFKNICMLAEKNLKDSNKSAIEIEQNLDLLSIFKNYVNYKIEEAEPIKLKKGGEFYLTKFENDKLFFNTTKDSNHFQDFVLTFDDFQKIYNADIEKKTLQDISDILETNSIQQKYAYILAIYKDFINKKDKFSNDNKNKDNITKKENYYLVIDEINRGNISKIFGELITLIEEDKRDVLEVTLPYSKKPFRVPSNLYIIGTMNSTDKSIALIDIALRRRFTFLKMEPNADLINDEKAREIFEELNKQIEKDLGKDYQLGHSYFMKIQNSDDLKFVLDYKIIPLLEEYYYGDDRLDEIIAICKI